MNKDRKRSLRRWGKRVGITLGAAIVVGALGLLVFGNALLNRYGKPRVERAFAQANSGGLLRIGKVHYAIGSNRLDAESATLQFGSLTIEAGRTSLSGVRWLPLAWGTPMADALDHARLEANDLQLGFLGGPYQFRCARMQASVPDSELIANQSELRPITGDEAFFASRNCRSTRYRVVVPECRVTGLVYRELLQGTSYQARSIELSRPSLDTLVHTDQQPAPDHHPLMVHEALAAIRSPLQVDHIRVIQGEVFYRERLMPGTEPGVLIFGNLDLSASGISNRGESAAAIALRGQADFMNAGKLRVEMSIPIHPSDLSLHYSGSLGAMDLTRLDAFLENAERLRIKSGTVHAATFDIKAAAGKAQGHVRASYSDLQVVVLDEEILTAKGFDNRIASFLVNVLKIRNSSSSQSPDAIAEGMVEYKRESDDTFLQFIWHALRSGVLDAIHP